MKKCLTGIIFFILTIFISGCGRQNNNYSIFEEAELWQAGATGDIFAETSDLQNEVNTNIPENENIEIDNENTVAREVLDILTLGGFENEWRTFYARQFEQLHPNVTINFETTIFPSNMTERMALTTRLMADPPDMLLFNSGSLVFEKMNVEAVFANLYGFFDDPNGINREDFFCGVFTAAETQGRLYHLPTYINLDFVSLNKRLFDGIGVDVSEITSITVDDEIDFFLRIMEAFPDEELLLNNTFSMMDALMREKLYNLDTGEVFVNTPEMYSRIERAMSKRQIAAHSAIESQKQ